MVGPEVPADVTQPIAVDTGVDASPDQRYAASAAAFPPWLLTDPIEFPPHHPTYGWACRVSGCEATLSAHSRQHLCVAHGKGFAEVKKDIDIDTYIRSKQACSARSIGWGLERRAPCRICGPTREALQNGLCTAHSTSQRNALKRGIDEPSWRAKQTAWGPLERCQVRSCVHDGENFARFGTARARICRGHEYSWRTFVRRSHCEPDAQMWQAWTQSKLVRESVGTLAGVRGQLTMTELPQQVQREIRYALHRHDQTSRRSHWRPSSLQVIVDWFVAEGIQSLSDPRIAEFADRSDRTRGERRILFGLPFAARSLILTETTARSEGWFDPAVVGGSPFFSSQGDENRIKVWDLTLVSQRWLRDLLWEYLKDVSLQPSGKRPVAGTVYSRIGGITLLSRLLREVRADSGEDPALLGDGDARAIKRTWDMWFDEKTPIIVSRKAGTAPTALSVGSRNNYMSSIRFVLRHSRDKKRLPPTMDVFIFGLPEYSRLPNQPRPRPLSYRDFQTLVSHESIARLEEIDRDDLGLADIWLTQAFQGGRISETMKLRLGCVGMIGDAQPYIWRDMSKVKVLDYGMPCYRPVYDRLLSRQEKTRAKLRRRYAKELEQLDARGRDRLMTKWDREMPLFPGATKNPDLVLEPSQSWFRDVWVGWFESLGLQNITTHQTRATLATSLLNNGAPAALVRQMLGHFSNEALEHYARYNDENMIRHLKRVWAAGPGTNKPGAIVLQPSDVTESHQAAADARIDLTVVPVERGLCRYGPVVGGAQCPFDKNCTDGPDGPCEHFVLTGADLAYWERKRDAAFHFAEGAPTDDAREYILSQWHPWEPVLTGLREALAKLGLLEAAETIDLRTPHQDFFDPVFSTGWPLTDLRTAQSSTLPDSPRESDE